MPIPFPERNPQWRHRAGARSRLWLVVKYPSRPSTELSLKDLPTGPPAAMLGVFSFGLWDILLVILATVSAFVIGSGRTFNAGRR